jgi:hypothetical protein
VSKETEAYLRSRIDALERDVQGWLAKWERDPEGVLREIEGVRGARGRCVAGSWFGGGCVAAW